MSVSGKFDKFTVVGYSGATVTLASKWKTIQAKFYSMSDIRSTLATYDPLGEYGWLESFKNLIREGNVKIGMTKEMATLAWGIPDKVNKDISRYNYSEQWVYRYGNYSSNYLYFDGSGTVTYIQN